jgi:hypothetical protein
MLTKARSHEAAPNPICRLQAACRCFQTQHGSCQPGHASQLQTFDLAGSSCFRTLHLGVRSFAAEETSPVQSPGLLKKLVRCRA